jgi:hypothetical protein
MIKQTAVALAFALVGCVVATQQTRRSTGPDFYTKLNEPPRPMEARAADSVAIYSTKAPDVKYVEVAQISDDGDDEAAALSELKRSAAEVGCDGLILQTTKIVSVANGEASDMRATGVCIMYVEGDGAWRAPTAEDDSCRAKRARLASAHTSDEKHEIIRSMPVECHRAQ